MKTKILILLFLFVSGFIFINYSKADQIDDSLLYRRYVRYLKYKDYQLYKKYKDSKEYKDDKEYSDLYRLYKQDPKKYWRYSKYKDSYEGYQDYKKYKKYSKYGKYAFFDNARNSKYGTSTYKQGYNRYKNNQVAATSQSMGNLVPTSSVSSGPDIKVGLFSFKKSDLKDDWITVKTNGSGKIKSEDGTTLGQVPSNTEVKISFDFDKREYRIVSVNLDKITSNSVLIVPDDPNTGVCTVGQNAKYRGAIEIRYATFTKTLWVINKLPIEQYAWGMGEAANNSPIEYLKAISIAYRTYGYWKVKNGTTYSKEGFQVTDTGSSQVYGGYNRENSQPNIVASTKSTNGIVVRYGDRIAITPYCSSTDGKTRSWEDVWGSKDYPWCKSVPDPLGIKSNATTQSGNHMVGMSATGAYNYAKQGWAFDKILKYYYQGVSLDRLW